MTDYLEHSLKLMKYSGSKKHREKYRVHFASSLSSSTFPDKPFMEMIRLKYTNGLEMESRNIAQTTFCFDIKFILR